MSKRKLPRDLEAYRLALLGVSDKKGELTPGLRATARGFSAADGYNLRDLKAGLWTPAMKRKVTKYHKELAQLTAQEKIIVHTRSPARLKHAQAIGGHDPKYQFKVAFVPGSVKAKVIWNADNTLTIRDRGYRKQQLEFDQRALARDPHGEIQGKMDQVKGAQTFAVMAGANVMYRETFTRKQLPAAIVALMRRYDGVKPIPKHSGNAGDKPGAHHYSKWLHGMVAYQFTVPPAVKAPAELARISNKNTELKLRRAAARKADERRRIKSSKTKRK